MSLKSPHPAASASAAARIVSGRLHHGISALTVQRPIRSKDFTMPPGPGRKPSVKWRRNSRASSSRSAWRAAALPGRPAFSNTARNFSASPANSSAWPGSLISLPSSRYGVPSGRTASKSSGSPRLWSTCSVSTRRRNRQPRSSHFTSPVSSAAAAMPDRAIMNGPCCTLPGRAATGLAGSNGCWSVTNRSSPIAATVRSR